MCLVFNELSTVYIVYMVTVRGKYQFVRKFVRKFLRNVNFDCMFEQELKVSNKILLMAEKISLKLSRNDSQ